MRTLPTCSICSILHARVGGLSGHVNRGSVLVSSQSLQSDERSKLQLHYKRDRPVARMPMKCYDGKSMGERRVRTRAICDEIHWMLTS